MKTLLLRDENEYPSDDILAKCLGGAKSAWDAFTSRLAEDFSDASLEWRFYKDGKSWLGKLVRKKKTVCWVSIWDQAFQTSFYFTSKDDQEIEGLPIALELRNAYRVQTPIGKLKPITLEVASKEALGDVFTLLGYKIGLK
jgi:hypothetical protein